MTKVYVEDGKLFIEDEGVQKQVLKKIDMMNSYVLKRKNEIEKILDGAVEVKFLCNFNMREDNL